MGILKICFPLRFARINEWRQAGVVLIGPRHRSGKEADAVSSMEALQLERLGYKLMMRQFKKKEENPSRLAPVSPSLDKHPAFAQSHSHLCLLSAVHLSVF